jgi:pyridoxine kinase
VYLCDPVMGDVGRGVFVRPGIPDFLRSRALQVASIITPNHYEFELLHGSAIESTEAAISAARDVLGGPRRPGPQTVIITSLRTPDLPADQLSTLVVTADRAWVVHTPFIDLDPLPNGMGDVFSAVVLGHVLNGKPIEQAAALGVSSLYALVSRTVPGQRDLPLVAAQDQLTRPGEIFQALSL